MAGTIFTKLTKFLVTEDFFVVNMNVHIYFIRRADVKDFDEKVDQLSYYDVKVGSIPMLHIFDSFTYEDFRMMPVDKRDMKIILAVSKQQGKNVAPTKNAIQISFKDRAFIWDLDHDFEIKSLHNIQDFAFYENFVVTGFKYHAPPPRTMRNQTTAFMQTNKNCTLISLEATPQTVSYCFRLYSALDLAWMVQIEEHLKAGGHLKLTKLCQTMYTTNIYGETFFSILYQYPDILDIAVK